ncbi:NAD(P)-dependent dehydrogenase (short-subunit alcohol dehydrogenase family) [Brevibacillus sp. AG162]|uniref:SDR family oxidoreductase n=1 Tax=Brevibacillus sp. AG162 TaxID=2572910 RepID=UPI0011511E2F|nr:SDR family oxidoreductase [Brevibacillus sp. AG162]TQK53609.1 NAD(P)-dependent dehydrogenase (short-subunit alcohol dehydrogenase family) [Brevibacillus sp. AG162]
MNKQMDQANQRLAVVTGGNRGIGREIARQLSVKGLQVLITTRDEEKGRQTVEEMRKEGLSVVYQVVDVTDAESIRQMVERVKSDFGRLDVLVNNAGIILDRSVSVLDVGESVMRETFETNYFGALRIIQASVPLMKEHRYGRIVNISSGLGAFDILQGLLGLKGSSSAYRLSKTMLNALTCLVAQDVADIGIKVNAVCPGRVQTDMGGEDAPITVEQGADTAVWLATMEKDCPNGGFFRERMPIAW